MKVSSVIEYLEEVAAPALQESYDNAGLITGSPEWQCTGILISLDATLEVIEEANNRNCNLVVSHHPIVFSGLKKITGRNYVEKAIIYAIKNDIALYAIHTNLDNVQHGVNAAIADKLGLINRSILLPKTGTLKKLFTFVPELHAEKVRNAVFEAGAGTISNYSECSFNTAGKGTFKANDAAKPFIGAIGESHQEDEIRIEVIFPAYYERRIIDALRIAHPYEEVAYDIVFLANNHPGIGSGLVGELPKPMAEKDFLKQIKEVFQVPAIKHTALTGREVKKVALCGGAGSFLISNALGEKAEFYITSDIKYHEFFDANNQMVLADVGHYESEQFTIDLLHGFLQQKFPNFATLKTNVVTNPVNYYL